MIALSPCLAALCALNIWIIENAAGCVVGQAEANGRCCDLCPPGEYVTGFCSEHQQTLCSPCKDGYYSSDYTLFDRCEKCHSCQQEYAEKCTPTVNANCSCHSGFLCSNNICSRCEENRCVAGEKVTRTGQPLGKGLIEYSYQCEPSCSDSEYFDVKEEICKPRMQCSLLGLAEQFPGNKTHNSVCDGAARHGNGGDFAILRDHVILIIGFALLCLTLLVLLSFACMKNVTKHKPYDNSIDLAVLSSNASNFHLSKEESGVQLITQDESKNSNTLSQPDLEKVTTL